MRVPSLDGTQTLDDLRDPQSLVRAVHAGFHPDGGEGYGRVALARSGWTCLPFKTGHYQTLVTGTGTTSESVQWTNRADPVGIGGQLRLTAASGNQSSVRLYHYFWGPRYALRVLRNSSTPEFSVRVDGRTKLVPAGMPVPELAYDGIAFTTEHFGRCAEFDDLDDGVHIAEISLPTPGSGTSNLYLVGYCIDRSVGIPDYPRLINYIPFDDVPTGTPAAPSVSSLVAVTNLLVSNPTSGALTYSLLRVSDYLIQEQSIASHTTFEWKPQGPMGGFQALTHVASGAGLRYSLGGYW